MSVAACFVAEPALASPVSFGVPAPANLAIFPMEPAPSFALTKSFVLRTKVASFFAFSFAASPATAPPFFSRPSALPSVNETASFAFLPRSCVWRLLLIASTSSPRGSAFEINRPEARTSKATLACAADSRDSVSLQPVPLDYYDDRTQAPTRGFCFA